MYFFSPHPEQLLASFDQAIQNQHVATWRFALKQQRHCYTHTAREWRDKAWLQPVTENDRLAFYVQKFSASPLTKDVYAYYLGHLAETFIRYFPAQFSEAHVTSSRAGEDDVLV
jgi:hypothetical protein